MDRRVALPGIGRCHRPHLPARSQDWWRYSDKVALVRINATGVAALEPMSDRACKTAGPYPPSYPYKDRYPRNIAPFLESLRRASKDRNASWISVRRARSEAPVSPLKS